MALGAGGLTARQDQDLAVAAKALFGFVCTADPGTGTAVNNEVTGGSPVYARKPVTWSTPDANGQMTATVTFDIPAGVTVAYAGLATASTGATRYLSGSIGTPVSQSQQYQHTQTYIFQNL